MDGDQREEWKVEDICIKCPDCSSRVTFSGVRKPAGLLDEIKKLQGIQKPLPKLQAWNQDYNR
jgi:DNA-directed RNA polymerase subunit RPC12/RpoP